jgi:hypothetical protein
MRETPIHLSEGEIANMQALIDQGELSKDAIKKHFEAEARNVYGFDAKRDRHGNWIEQGIGSKGRETSNHFNSIRRYEGKEAYADAVREIWKRDPKRAGELGLPKIKEPA